MENKFQKHYDEGVKAAQAGNPPVNPYIGPAFAGVRGQGKSEAFTRGVASVLGTARKAEPRSTKKGGRRERR